MQNDLMLTYMTSVLSFLVFIPLILILYLTITKKMKLKPILLGVVTYMLIYIVTQLLFPLVNLITGGLLTSHFAASLIIVGILTPLLTQFFTYFVFQRLLPDNREWTDGAGFGLGLGVAWVIATIGVSVFFTMTFRLAMLDGSFDAHVAALTQEEAQQFFNTRDQLAQTPLMNFVLVGIAGLCAMVVHTAMSILMLAGIRKNSKKFMLAALVSNLILYVPFYLATGMVVNYWCEGILLVLAGLAVFYIIRSCDMPDDDEPYQSRPSPLLNRK